MPGFRELLIPLLMRLLTEDEDLFGDDGSGGGANFGGPQGIRDAFPPIATTPGPPPGPSDLTIPFGAVQNVGVSPAPPPDLRLLVSHDPVLAQMRLREEMMLRGGGGLASRGGFGGGIPDAGGLGVPV